MVPGRRGSGRFIPAGSTPIADPDTTDADEQAESVLMGVDPVPTDTDSTEQSVTITPGLDSSPGGDPRWPAVIAEYLDHFDLERALISAGYAAQFSNRTARALLRNPRFTAGILDAADRLVLVVLAATSRAGLGKASADAVLRLREILAARHPVTRKSVKSKGISKDTPDW